MVPQLPSDMRPPTSAHGQLSPKTLSRTGHSLFLVFCAYLVLPVLEVPLLGLSLSAPLLFLAFVEVFLGRRRLKILYGQWIVICYVFFVGLLLSLAGNTIIDGTEIESADLLNLIRYVYWIIAFYTTLVIVSTSGSVLNTLGSLFAIGTLILGCLRLYEAMAFGRWGAWTNPSLMSQNSYAIQFSTFTPFLFCLPFMLRGAQRRIAIFGVILLFVAMAGNGSRSSWIAVATSLGLFLLLFGVTQRRGVWRIGTRIAVLVGISILVIASAPSSLLEPVVSRFDTLQSLEGDKSFAIRQLMIQKGQRLFEENPVFGAGIGRFTKASVPLDIPLVLTYAQQDHFDEKSSHNSYISLLGETGLVGVIPFAVLHLFLFVNGITSAIRLAQRGQIMGIAVFCAYVGMSIHLWALSGLTGTAPWFIYGLVAGMIEFERRAGHPLTPETIL